MAHITQILEQINERQIRMEEMQQKILIQTTKTNGRVDTLTAAMADQVEVNKKQQDEINNLKNWKSKLSGVWYALLIIGTVLGGVLMALFEYATR